MAGDVGEALVVLGRGREKTQNGIETETLAYSPEGLTGRGREKTQNGIETEREPLESFGLERRGREKTQNGIETRRAPLAPHPAGRSRQGENPERD